MAYPYPAYPPGPAGPPSSARSASGIRLSRAGKVALGAATLWPLLNFLVLVALWSLAENGAIAHSPIDIAASNPTFLVVLGLDVFTLLVGLSLIGVYAYLIFKRLDADDTQRLVWLLVVVLGQTIGMIVFYALHVWPGLMTRGRMRA